MNPRTACLLPVALLVGACAQSPSGPPTTVTAPTVVSVDEAAIQLACRAETLCARPPAPENDQETFTSEDIYGMYASPTDADTRGPT